MKRLMSAGVQLMMLRRSSSDWLRSIDPSMACGGVRGGGGGCILGGRGGGVGVKGDDGTMEGGRGAAPCAWWAGGCVGRIWVTHIRSRGALTLHWARKPTKPLTNHNAQISYTVPYTGPVHRCGTPHAARKSNAALPCSSPLSINPPSHHCHCPQRILALPTLSTTPTHTPHTTRALAAPPPHTVMNGWIPATTDRPCGSGPRPALPRP